MAPEAPFDLPPEGPPPFGNEYFLLPRLPKVRPLTFDDLEISSQGAPSMEEQMKLIEDLFVKMFSPGANTHKIAENLVDLGNGSSVTVDNLINLPKDTNITQGIHIASIKSDYEIKEPVTFSLVDFSRLNLHKTDEENLAKLKFIEFITSAMDRSADPQIDLLKIYTVFTTNAADGIDFWIDPAAQTVRMILPENKFKEEALVFRGFNVVGLEFKIGSNEFIMGEIAYLIPDESPKQRRFFLKR